MFYQTHFYSEHFVFALHLHAFFYLVFTLLIFIPDSQAVMLTEGARVDSSVTTTEVNAAHPFWGFLGDLLAFACMAYAFLALKSTYQQPVGRTLVKGFFLTITYASLLGIALVISLVTTFLFY